MTFFLECEGLKCRCFRRRADFTPISCYIVDSIAYIAATVGTWHPEKWYIIWDCPGLNPTERGSFEAR